MDDQEPRDLHDLRQLVQTVAERLRRVEDREDPTGRRIAQDVDQLRADVRRIDTEGVSSTKIIMARIQLDLVDLAARMERMDTGGTAGVRLTLQRVEHDLERLDQKKADADEVQALVRDRDSNRRAIRAAVTAALVAIGTTVIGLILRVKP